MDKSIYIKIAQQNKQLLKELAEKSLTKQVYVETACRVVQNVVELLAVYDSEISDNDYEEIMNI